MDEISLTCHPWGDTREAHSEARRCGMCVHMSELVELLLECALNDSGIFPDIACCSPKVKIIISQLSNYFRDLHLYEMWILEHLSCYF